MLNQGLFSSASCHWETPKELYDSLNAEFHFDDDPCPIGIPDPLYSDDGLAREWGSRTFLNPPYGRAIAKWIHRAYTEGQNGKLVVCLLPSRTDTKWWHEYCMKASEIRFIRGRLKFSNAKFNAPFPSVIVIFKERRKIRTCPKCDEYMGTYSQYERDV